MLVKAALVALGAVLIYLSFPIVFNTGVYPQGFKHYPGKCSRVSGVDFGSEDFQVSSSGLTFITTGVSINAISDAFKEYLRVNNARGRILLFDFNNPQVGAIELGIKTSPDFNPESFRPHGISLLEDKVKGEHLLYVINHPEGEVDRVEKFRFEPRSKKLRHEKSFFSDKMHITNNLAVLEEDQFYISNYLYFNSQFWGSLESSFYLPLGSLLFFNSSDMMPVVKGMNNPNGVAVSKDNKFVYVALSGMQQMRVYARNSDNSLRLLQQVDLPILPDNIHFSDDGQAIYTGNHPSREKVFQYLDDPHRMAPSQVFRYPLKDGQIDVPGITELFYDHGDIINASTVAAIRGNKLLIGSIMDKLVLCDVNIPL